MHPNPAFRKTPAETSLDFAARRGFGVLSINGEHGPLAAHVPFVLSQDGKRAETHLVRSNPLARALTQPQPALLAVTGPDGYVSPDWYGAEDQVPTWNYVAVHLRGRLEVLPAEDLRRHLDALSAEFEERLLPKAPWRTSKMPGDILERMMRQIVACSLAIEDVQGTWKLNQNKPEAARLGAATEMAASSLGVETAALALLMRAGET
ncbi:FMN-binding negative transcriptional regulator [Ostreiculturibacter nitratireducens]|uniref:FMN-binding negative transcriptional regulator n=1 Tax=Ostreiculturibacter nitratireducens TaxID=3075226 RepID=UPI0031B644F3